MTREGSIKSMLVNDLGYCCLQRFFTLYPSTTLVAARLGVTERAVRYVKAKVKNGEGLCSNATNCRREK